MSKTSIVPWLVVQDSGVQCTASLAEPVICECGDISGDWCDLSYAVTRGCHGWLTGTVHCVRLDNT